MRVPGDLTSPARTVLIVWWSATGAARALAEAAEGAARASAPEMMIRRVRCDQATADDLLQADALMFACPEMLGSMAGMMKDFFDRTYYPALERLAGKPYAVMISAGSDGQGAIRQIQRIAAGWRLRPVAEPLLVCTHAQTAEAILADKCLSDSALERARELGAAIASGVSLGIW